ncbi:acyltransferase family protein [Streptococcus sp. H49]|uniref:acyltransferase family protein n=1 Tax=Streptococcus huangxiaojuni TaxID=3237239 RepID=UPI0034A41C75
MREKWIDTAKGIAILLVIIGHVSAGLEGIWNFSFVYGIHLVIFFVLSGYTSKKKRINGDYLNARFSRLMVPYFYTCLLIMLTDIFNSYLIYHESSTASITRLISRDLVRSFFASGTYTIFGTIELGSKIGAIWFLPAMFFAGLLLQAVLNYFGENDAYAGTALALIALTGHISAQFLWLPFSIQSGMTAAFFMWIGFAIRKHDLLSKVRWSHYLFAQIILLLGIFLGYCNVNFVTADISDVIVSVLVGLSGCLLVYGISVIYKGRILEYIGRISLTVLCTHLYALEVLAPYVNKSLDLLKLEGNLRVWACIAIEILFAVLTASAVEKLKHSFSRRKSSFLEKRQTEGLDENTLTVDIAKGLLFLSILFSLFRIDGNLRTILFSCQIPALVFLYGYSYGSSKSVIKTIKISLGSFLLPYGLLVIGDLLLQVNRWTPSFLDDKLSQYLFGLSLTKGLWTDLPSVGLAAFILLLFLISLIYTAVDRLLKTDRLKWACCLSLSLLGLTLGEIGYWLPWSLDIACYAIIFYRLGHQFHQKQWLQTVLNNSFLYFILSPVWAYMIYIGGMNMIVRQYEPYGMVIIGSLAGTLLAIGLADYIRHNWPFAQMFLKKVGKSFTVALVVSALLGEQIETAAAFVLSHSTFAYLFLSIMLQVLLSGAVIQILSSGKTGISKLISSRR